MSGELQFDVVILSSASNMAEKCFLRKLCLVDGLFYGGRGRGYVGHIQVFARPVAFFREKKVLGKLPSRDSGGISLKCAEVKNGLLSFMSLTARTEQKSELP